MPISIDSDYVITTVQPTAPPWTIGEINSLDQDAFTARLGFLFESSPWIAARAWVTRPWSNREALHGALQEVVRESDRKEQLDLIRAHPDLAGRVALAGRLGRESTAEQRAAGLDPGALTPADIEAFNTANESYRARFGFPFVICAREHNKDEILASLGERLQHARQEEIAIALAEIYKIAWYRLADVVTPDSTDRGVA
jgi:OHCU decarboxylase